MAPQPSRAVFDTLKRAIRSRSITYKKLGTRVGLSESAVKKIFSKGDCSLSRLGELAEAAGLSLAELFEQAERPAFERFRIDESRQRWLLEHPDEFWLYWRLVMDRLTPREIGRRWGLSDHRMTRSLARLDREGLIEFGPDDRVRLPHGELVQWADGGPLLTWLERSWSSRLVEDLLGDVPGFLRLHELHLREETARELEAALHALADEFLRRARREQTLTREPDRHARRLLVATARGGFVPGGSETLPPVRRAEGGPNDIGG